MGPTVITDPTRAPRLQVLIRSMRLTGQAISDAVTGPAKRSEGREAALRKYSRPSLFGFATTTSVSFMSRDESPFFKFDSSALREFSG